MISAEGAAKTRPCKKCGVHFTGIRCKECLRKRNLTCALSKPKRSPEKAKEYRDRFYAKNPEKVAAYNKAWRAKNLEKFYAAQKAWKNAHPELTLMRSRRAKEQLNDAYVASLLGFPVAQVPKQLIELKRAHLKITRYLKENK